MCRVPGVVVATLVVGSLDVVVSSWVVVACVVVACVVGSVVVVATVVVVCSVVEVMAVYRSTKHNFQQLSTFAQEFHDMLKCKAFVSSE